MKWFVSFSGFLGSVLGLCESTGHLGEAMHVHNWSVIAVKLDHYDFYIQDFLWKRLWRRCNDCGSREEKWVDIRLTDKEITNLYSGKEHETVH